MQSLHNVNTYNHIALNMLALFGLESYFDY